MAQKISLAQTTAQCAYEIRFGSDFWLCLFFTLYILFSLVLSCNFLFFGVMQAKHFFFLHSRSFFAEALSRVCWKLNEIKRRKQKKNNFIHSFSTFWFNVTLWNEETMRTEKNNRRITTEAVKNEISTVEFQLWFRTPSCTQRKEREKNAQGPKSKRKKMCEFFMHPTHDVQGMKGKKNLVFPLSPICLQPEREKKKKCISSTNFPLRVYKLLLWTDFVLFFYIHNFFFVLHSAFALNGLVSVMLPERTHKSIHLIVIFLFIQCSPHALLLLSSLASLDKPNVYY